MGKVSLNHEPQMLSFLNDVSPMPEGTHLVAGPNPNRVDGSEQAGSDCKNSIRFY